MRNSKENPKLILLRLKMSKIEMLEKVKSGPARISVAVVILTSSKKDPDIQRCFGPGANSHIAKPLESGIFFNVLKAIGWHWTVPSQIPVS